MMHIRRWTTGPTLLLLVLQSAAQASATEPGVGDPFPQTLSAPDQNRIPQTLHSLLGSKGAALFFVRSADWCPFCKGQLVDANRHLAAFKQQGLNVVSISVDEIAPIAEFAAKQKIGFPMLSDPKGDINLALGIRETRYPVGSNAFGVPRPTLYVVDSRGVIRLRYQERTFLTRPNLDKVLKDVAKLRLN
jgi:peroxiredoxin